MRSSTRDTNRKPAGGLLRLLAIGFTIAAIVRELRLPAAQRTWHGLVAGVVPYDFRPPTVARARERLWSPDTPGIVVPTIFGVGWTVNLGRVVALVRDRQRG